MLPHTCVVLCKGALLMRYIFFARGIITSFTFSQATVSPRVDRGSHSLTWILMVHWYKCVM